MNASPLFIIPQDTWDAITDVDWALEIEKRLNPETVVVDCPSESATFEPLWSTMKVRDSEFLEMDAKTFVACYITPCIESLAGELKRMGTVAVQKLPGTLLGDFLRVFICDGKIPVRLSVLREDGNEQPHFDGVRFTFELLVAEIK